jgi:hypothetical protein
VRDDLFSHAEEVEADLAARHAKEERIRALVEVATAPNRRELAERRRAFAAATLAQLQADVERARVCHRGNKH